MNPEGRVALVTGASSGIGRVTALRLAERGADVVVVARRREPLEAVAEACRRRAPRSLALAADLSGRAAAERVVEETLERLGRLDVLVNNAAMPKHKHVWHTRPEEAEEVLRTNFLACVWTTFAALPAMLRQGEGCVVNVSSFAAVVVPPREALYAASKAALDAFSQGLEVDLQGSGIHVGRVVVGAIDTEIWDKLDEPPAFRGRRHPPEVVTDAILRVIEKRRAVVQAPRFSPPLTLARWMAFLAPGLLRRSLRRMDPVPRAVVEGARGRAARGLPLGQGLDGAPE